MPRMWSRHAAAALIANIYSYILVQTCVCMPFCYIKYSKHFHIFLSNNCGLKAKTKPNNIFEQIFKTRLTVTKRKNKKFRVNFAKLNSLEIYAYSVKNYLLQVLQLLHKCNKHTHTHLPYLSTCLILQCSGAQTIIESCSWDNFKVHYKFLILMYISFKKFLLLSAIKIHYIHAHTHLLRVDNLTLIQRLITQLGSGIKSPALELRTEAHKWRNILHLHVNKLAT